MNLIQALYAALMVGLALLPQLLSLLIDNYSDAKTGSAAAQ